METLVAMRFVYIVGVVRSGYRFPSDGRVNVWVTLDSELENWR